MNIASKLFGWLIKGSAKNATNPTPTATPATPNFSGEFPGQSPPIELAVEQDLIMGTNLSLGRQDSVAEGPNGELIRSHKNVSILCGCGHIVSQLQPTQEQGKAPVRGIAGECFYCDIEFNELMSKRLITAFDVERRSSVCSDCAKITVSGKLCCPKHYIAITDANGGIMYLGLDDQIKQQQLAEEQARNDVIQKVFVSFTSLFSEQKPEDTHE